MKQELAELAAVLKKHAENHGCLLALEEQKRGAIIENDIENLRRISGEEEAIAAIVRENENARRTACVVIAGQLGLRPEAKLTELLKVAAEKEDCSAIVEVRGTLSEILEKLRYRTMQNADLLSRSLQHIEKFFASIGEASTCGPVYARDGSKNGLRLNMLDQTA